MARELQVGHLCRPDMLTNESDEALAVVALQQIDHFPISLRSYRTRSPKREACLHAMARTPGCTAKKFIGVFDALDAIHLTYHRRITRDRGIRPRPAQASQIGGIT